MRVGFKALADTVESSLRSRRIRPGQDAGTGRFRDAGRGPEFPLVQRTPWPAGAQAGSLLQDYKIYAAMAYARLNKINRTTIDSPNARLGIIASGKSYMDVLEALEELGITEENAAQIGVRVFKVSMPWPLEPDGVREFSKGLEEILVVEEKRQVVEYQLKEHLYNWHPDVRPRVIGKFDDQGEWVHPRGEWLLPAKADFSIAQIARVIAGRIARFHQSDLIKARLMFLEAKEAVLKKAVSTPPRPAYYCSGCPHNTSTKVPDGSFALAGIGCHVMATSIYPEHTKTTCQMGGEGAAWIGQAPFSKLPHVFANLGDGTYFHSGHLAIRAALAANVNITYKILYNDAVAMTGGQPSRRADFGQPDRAADGSRRHQTHRRRHGGFVALRGSLATARDGHGARSQGHGHRAARVARNSRRIRIDIRPDLCGGKAPAPQEGRVSQGDAARVHQRSGLRRLRRLRGAIQLHVDPPGRNRIRPQARDRPVILQPGLSRA
jgi:indolepyruvate ferredoxin oxidoreductase